MISNSQSFDVGPILAAIDAGGTTFKCALIREGEGVIANLRVPTATPSETLEACSRFFHEQAAKGLTASAMGIASFGPIDVDVNSPTYGTILDGPKLGWAKTNLKSYFEAALSIPVAVDTDVNGALLAEMMWGAAQGTQVAAYMTIGTGIGAGLFANGSLIGKPSHPEFGHIRLKHHDADKDFMGVCSIHGDCLEGLASATALTKRFGDPIKLSQDHIGWEIEAFYLAQACNVLALTLRPEKIILGGGLMLAPHLLGSVRTQYANLINGYLDQSPEDIDKLIVTPGLGDDAGLYGGAYLAKSLIAN
ncbi:fructokinase [Litorimonas cladophorae]|uniref:fructokinase n=1 Tax=Litorimonas cladophorae TaxID=1220491 RepID=A0A918NKR6_9PROT|nr:ROK family protein [Litorimonas cladophorae]GGX76028.1 fructokinase [Litorimonas cladophorae]